MTDTHAHQWGDWTVARIVEGFDGAFMISLGRKCLAYECGAAQTPVIGPVLPMAGAPTLTYCNKCAAPVAASVCLTCGADRPAPVTEGI